MTESIFQFFPLCPAHLWSGFCGCPLCMLWMIEALVARKGQAGHDLVCRGASIWHLRLWSSFGECIQGGLSPSLCSFLPYSLFHFPFQAVNLNRWQRCFAKDGLCLGQQVMTTAYFNHSGVFHMALLAHAEQPMPLEEWYTASLLPCCSSPYLLYIVVPL